MIDAFDSRGQWFKFFFARSYPLTFPFVRVRSPRCLSFSDELWELRTVSECRLDDGTTLAF